MKLAISFQSQYLYAEPVSFSVHLYRLFPRAGRDLRVLHAAFQTNAEARVTYWPDAFIKRIA